MPELPEVETVKNVLKKRILNKTIKNVNIFYHKTIADDNELFLKKIKNQKINDIKRRGKWLLFELDNYYMLSHLRMEGKYLFRKKGEKVAKHEHVAFLLDDDTEFRYHDTRKFGRIYLVDKDKLENSKLKNLGPEPGQITFKDLKKKYQKKTIAIKTALLDQTIFVGLGNIYADEVLFLSKINPTRKTNSLTDFEIKEIIKNTQIVLNKAIDLGGSTIKTYTPEEGVSGKFQNELLVHSKKGDNCQRCKCIIEKTKVNGRGTYYCKNCQK